MMLAAVDWLPTFAGLAGASNPVPKDRPTDGVDASAFLMGKSFTTGSQSYKFYGVDGQLTSVIWRYYKRYYKMILRHVLGPPLEATNTGIVIPPLPKFSDLSSDPHEDFNLWNATLTMGGCSGRCSRALILYEKSVKQYPNIKPGPDFTGYRM
jgi:arylsulfatase